LELKSKSLRDTNKIAKKIARMLHHGDVVCLSGDLGAGKTTFTKALLSIMGVKEVVASPTFTIAKEYRVKRGVIYHLDLYRIENDLELVEIGFQEMLDTACLVVVEWPDIAKGYLDQRNVISVSITFDDAGNRIFNIEGVMK